MHLNEDPCGSVWSYSNWADWVTGNKSVQRGGPEPGLSMKWAHLWKALALHQPGCVLTSRCVLRVALRIPTKHFAVLSENCLQTCLHSWDEFTHLSFLASRFLVWVYSLIHLFIHSLIHSICIKKACVKLWGYKSWIRSGFPQEFYYLAEEDTVI